VTEETTGRRWKTVSPATVLVLFTFGLIPTLAPANSGQILSAWTEPCYRGSTFTLHWTVLNTSSFDWGCQYCPAYAIKVVPSWRQSLQWFLYEWAPPDPMNPSNIIPLRPGETASSAWHIFPGPPARGTHYLDLYLCPPDSPGACNYPPVDHVQIPLECVEWPDLAIVSGSVFQPAGRPGTDIITAVFRVQNLGPGDAVRTTWAEIRLSTDEEFDKTDPFVVSTVVPPLAAGEYRDFCLWAPVPSDAPGGKYYVLFKCDVLDEIPDESTALGGGEDNNLFRFESFTVLRPELEVTGGPIVPESGPVGTAVHVSFYVSNIGTGPSPPCVATVWLSPDPQSTWGYQWFSVNVPALAPGGKYESLSDPSAPWAMRPIDPGTYHVLVLCDYVAPFQVDEADKANNYLDLGTFTVELPSAPDLVVTAGEISPESPAPGQTVYLTLRVENRGDVAAPESTLTIYLSPRGGDLVNILNVTVPALGAGEARNIVLEATLPGSLPEGLCSIVAECDAGGAVAESDEQNNETIIGEIVGQTGAKHWSLYR